MNTPTRQEPPILRTIRIPPFGLEGSLAIPRTARALVLFAHGSGSSRLSPRNNYVARALQVAGLGTLLFDLLTDEEAAVRANVFDIRLLAERLQAAASWIERSADTRNLALGIFGASTGAAAALVASTYMPSTIAAIVSRGGRPDLAEPILKRVRAPTLLIVGGDDLDVLAMNRAALAELQCKKELRIIPGASHLFEEPGTLDQVIEHARAWFLEHLGKATPADAGARQP